MDGLDLATAATIGAEYSEGPADARRHIVAYDYGMKRNILRLFLKNGCRVTVVPAATPAARVRELAPDGLFLSNGPGDPAAVSYAIATLRELARLTPDFRDLPRPPAARFGARRGDGEAPVWASGGEPSGTGSCDRTSTYHVTKPRLRGPGRYGRRPRCQGA